MYEFVKFVANFDALLTDFHAEFSCQAAPQIATVNDMVERRVLAAMTLALRLMCVFDWFAFDYKR